MNTALGNTVGPLPFHAIKQYPYAPGENYPADAAHHELPARLQHAGGEAALTTRASRAGYRRARAATRRLSSARYWSRIASRLASWPRSSVSARSASHRARRARIGAPLLVSPSLVPPAITAAAGSACARANSRAAAVSSPP